MVIRVNHKKTLGRAVEWSDKRRKSPIAFILKCPYCRKEQWVQKKNLYTGHDGSTMNHRCKKCGVGIARKRMYGDPGYSGPRLGFSPKCPGWRSIYD